MRSVGKVGMRERLIGAIAIVVVAIVTIPWLVSRARYAHQLSLPRATLIPANAAATAASPGLSLGLPPLSTASDGASAPVAVTAESPAPPAPAATTVTATAGMPTSGWGVQAASLTDPGDAAGLSARLIRAGFKAFVSPHLVGGKTWYRVYVGPYPDAAAARSAAPKIAALSKTQVIVRQFGGKGG